MVGYGAIGACVLLGAALAADVRTMTIPNRLTLPALVLGISAHGIMNGLPGLRFAVGGAAAGLGIMFLLYLLRSVGAGDVKVFGALGAWLGPVVASDLAIYSIMIAGAYGLLASLTWRIGMRRVWAWAGWLAGSDPQDHSEVFGIGIRIPFMLAVCPGAAAAWVLG